MAKNHQKTVKEHGVKALTNQDLKQLNERLQLEQQHRDLSGRAPTRFKSGHAHVKTILGVAGTLNNLHSQVNSPLVKAAIKVAKAKKG